MASRGVCVLVVCCEASRYEGILLGTTRVRERNTFPTAIGTFRGRHSRRVPLLALVTRSVHIVSMAAAAQKGSVVGKPASDILLTDESTQEMATLRENIIDGKSTVVLEWWGFH